MIITFEAQKYDCIEECPSESAANIKLSKHEDGRLLLETGYTGVLINYQDLLYAAGSLYNRGDGEFHIKRFYNDTDK